MKKINILFFALLAMVASSCVKNDPVLVTDTTDPVLEWDASTYNSKAAGVNYPILTRVPGFSRAVSTTVDPLINRASGTIKFRVNVVGAPTNAPRTISFQAATPPTTVTAAIAGTHYTITGTAIVAANTTFADVDVQVLNTGVSSTTPRVLVLQINGGDGLRANPNYNLLGISIGQN